MKTYRIIITTEKTLLMQANSADEAREYSFQRIKPELHKLSDYEIEVEECNHTINEEPFVLKA